MATKPTFKQKTFWGGIAAIFSGVGLIVSGNAPEGIQVIATGVLAIFVRDAVK
jgi:hypothetical protein